MTRKIVMLGTRFDTMGGIASVVNVYRAEGLFDRWPITYLATHRDGSKWDKLGQALKAWSHFLGLLLSRQVALVHIHLSSNASFWRKLGFMLLSKWTGTPYLVHLHGSEFQAFFSRLCAGGRACPIRYAFRGASRVIVLSSQWQQWVAASVPGARTEVIFNPVSLPPVGAAPDRSALHVLSLGRLGERKGTYDLLAAFTEVHPEFPSARLTLAGDGEIEKVRGLVQQLGLTGVVDVPGWTVGEAKQRLLGSASIYALPSYNEGLPMSLLEAMAVGLPVLSSPIGGIPDAVRDGIEGWLVPSGDRVGLAAALRKMFRDDAARQAMGHRARLRVETVFSADVLLPKLEALYREVLEA